MKEKIAIIMDRIYVLSTLLLLIIYVSVSNVINYGKEKISKAKNIICDM